MNFLQMQDRVKLYVRDRPTYDTVIKELLNEKADSIAMPFFFPHLDVVSASIPTVVGTTSIAIPDDIYAVLSAKNLDVPEYRRARRVLEIKEMEEYDMEDISYSEVPRFGAQFGMNLYLWPTPDAIYNYILRGRRLPTPMVADIDEPEFPRDWHSIIAKLAASELHFVLGEDERGMSVKNEALGEISARQEIRTMQRRNRTGQISIERKMTYRRGGYRGQIEE